MACEAMGEKAEMRVAVSVRAARALVYIMVDKVGDAVHRKRGQGMIIFLQIFYYWLDIAYRPHFRLD
jgi:hypothetical protein